MRAALYLAALSAALVALGACEDYRPSLVGPAIASSGGSPAGSISAITGTWRRLLIINTKTDILTSETTWVFASGGTCERTVITNSVALGFPQVDRNACTYSLRSGLVTIQFAFGLPVSFSASVSGGRLFLGGLEFQRVG